MNFHQLSAERKKLKNELAAQKVAEVCEVWTTAPQGDVLSKACGSVSCLSQRASGFPMLLLPTKKLVSNHSASHKQLKRFNNMNVLEQFGVKYTLERVWLVA